MGAKNREEIYGKTPEKGYRIHRQSPATIKETKNKIYFRDKKERSEFYGKLAEHKRQPREVLLILLAGQTIDGEIATQKVKN